MTDINKCLPCRDICDCMTFNSPDNTILLDKTDCTFTVAVNIAALPTIYSPADGSETKINVGTGLSKSGIGTTGSPYLLTNTGVLTVNGSSGNITIAAPTGAETHVTAGTGITVTGSGTTGSPYIVTCTVSPGTLADGTETKVTVGTGLSISGNGSTATPYLLANTGVLTVNGSSGVVTVPTYDGSETKLSAGTNVTITGTGTIVDPYIVNASTGGGGSCASTILPYTGAVCCKSLDTALIASAGITGANNTGACTHTLKLTNLVQLDATYSSNFVRLVDVSGQLREGATYLYKENDFFKARGYMQWTVATTPVTTFTDCFLVSGGGTLGAQVVPPTTINRDFYVKGIESVTEEAYDFVVRCNMTTKQFQIRGFTSVSYPSNKVWYINLESIFIEST